MAKETRPFNSSVPVVLWRSRGDKRPPRHYAVVDGRKAVIGYDSITALGDEALSRRKFRPLHATSKGVRVTEIQTKI